MSAIAKCESQYRQFDATGALLRGLVNSKDVGVMQINEYYHLVDSKKLGYDIKTLVGNIQYGAYLLKHQGTAPWNASKKCWSKLIHTL